MKSTIIAILQDTSEKEAKKLKEQWHKAIEKTGLDAEIVFIANLKAIAFEKDKWAVIE